MKTILPDLIKLLISAIAAAAACCFMGRVLPESMTTIGLLARLIAATAVSFIVYLIFCILLRVGSLQTAIESLKRRSHK